MRAHLPRYSSTGINRIWTPERTREIYKMLWRFMIDHLTMHGWRDSCKSKAYGMENLESVYGRGHEVLDVLKDYIYETGLINAHAGLTSSDITDNARLIQCRESVDFIGSQVYLVLNHITGRLAPGSFCLGYTHWQPAQRLTWRHRLTCWLHPLRLIVAGFGGKKIRLKGFGGATGTGIGLQILMAQPEDNGINKEAMPQLDDAVHFWYGPTEYTLQRLQSSDHHDELACAHFCSAIAGQLYKIAQDIRFLVHTGELKLSRSKEYRGSSAMPGKNNPIEAEKICSLTRMVPGCYQMLWECLALNGLERTLDGSAAIKETLPRMFGLVSHSLYLMSDLLDGLSIDYARCDELLQKYRDAATSEEKLADLTKHCGDRVEAYQRFLTEQTDKGVLS